MVVDTSALVCVLLAEPDSMQYLQAMHAVSICRMSAANGLETSLIITSRYGEPGQSSFERLLGALDCLVDPIDSSVATIAYGAWCHYGKGRHPAALNFGDCFSYALAKLTSEPRLFKGHDFSQTDIESESIIHDSKRTTVAIGGASINKG